MCESSGLSAIVKMIMVAWLHTEWNGTFPRLSTDTTTITTTFLAAWQNLLDLKSQKCNIVFSSLCGMHIQICIYVYSIVCFNDTYTFPWNAFFAYLFSSLSDDDDKYYNVFK